MSLGRQSPQEHPRARRRHVERTKYPTRLSVICGIRKLGNVVGQRVLKYVACAFKNENPGSSNALIATLLRGSHACRVLIVIMLPISAAGTSIRHQWLPPVLIAVSFVKVLFFRFIHILIGVIGVLTATSSADLGTSEADD